MKCKVFGWALSLGFCQNLRSEAHYLGFPSNFTIYDTQDSLNVLKKVLKDLNIDQELYKPKKKSSS